MKKGKSATMSLTALVPADLDAKVEEYRRIRPLLTILHGALYRLISKSDQFACAKRLKMLVKQGGKKIFVFEHEVEMEIFQDYLIYMHRPHGINAVQQMLNGKRYSEGSDELRLLKAMATARFSVFQIKEIVGTAGIIAPEMLTGDAFFIMDLTLPRQQNVVGIMMGLRIFPFDGYWSHTGATLALGKGGDFKPTGGLTTVAEERELNEGIIFDWRSCIRELDE